MDVAINGGTSATAGVERMLQGALMILCGIDCSLRTASISSGAAEDTLLPPSSNLVWGLGFRV